MLKLTGITKVYASGDTPVHALKGINLEFRKNEFVSVLGQSGCGKTTMLNIIGGLDRYTDGDLIINGKSTKTFKDSDWDAYRNHSIGFVFQSYNLIPHQTVLANVELALTLSGVSKSERRRRATNALERVGLSDQIHKYPRQLSGGQMQRVAIARALVNDPEILLADEPTGALDTQTSIQVMDILKEVANDRLVIMVTHNPDLAREYSTRIIQVLDGLVIDDSNPYDSSAEEVAVTDADTPVLPAKKKKKNKKGEKTSMSFLTALSLSFTNLRTKKGRTIMTSFAGSIGIIGIALILALSTGINAFITQVQEDTLSTYPLTIQKQTQDMSAMLSAMTSVSETTDYRDSGKIHVDNSLGTMMSAMTSTVENDLESFKKYLDSNRNSIEDHVSDIQYTYDYNLQVFNVVNVVDEDGKETFEARKIGMETVFEHMGEAFSGMSELMEMGGGAGINVFSEMINNQDLLDQQYDVIAGKWPSPDSDDEVVLVVNSNNQLSKMTLYMLGILDPDEIDAEMESLMSGNYKDEKIEPFSYDYFLNTEFKLLTTADFYKQWDDDKHVYESNGKKYNSWYDLREYPGFEQEEFIKENGKTLKISGIVRPKEGAAATSISGAVGYTKALTDYILQKNENSKVINQQKETPDYNVLTGIEFKRTSYTPETIFELVDKIDNSTMEQFYAYMTNMVKSDPDMAAQLKVTKDNFSGMLMLMPAEDQAKILTKVVENAAKNNPAGCMALCAVLTQMTEGKITVTTENFIALIPSLGQSGLWVALNGVEANEQMPFPIAGFPKLVDDETMNAIYSEMDTLVMNMEVNRDIFVSILSTMDKNDENFIMIEKTLYDMAPQIDETYDSVLKTLDDAEKASPASINFYAKDFESKEIVEQFISDYNDKADEKQKLQYTDLVGTLMSSVTIIVNAISYVLIAFVSISLVVSSIMIGIITNISVLERTKEIGILRSVGASKKDVSRVFNAETLIVGFAAGVLGIVTTLLLCIPISAIVQYFTGIESIRAILPWQGAIILVAISMVLTLIAGIIPSRSAAKKDPVVALRTE